MTEAASDEIVPRWGHAAVYIPSPPALLVQGGKIDPSSSYAYSSSPNNNQALLLPLDASFSSSMRPFMTFNAPSAPTYAWHTFTPISQQDGTSQFLSFGGDGGTSEAVQTAADSAWIVKVDSTSSPSAVNYTHETTAWGSQPMRRIYHSAVAPGTGGKTYITGGLKDDGSGATFSDVYSYDPVTNSFLSLPSLPIGLYHHTSVLLPNGTLIALGGAYTSPTTGSAALQPYSTIYILNTMSSSPFWSERTVGGAPPSGRRGATAVLNGEGTKAFLFGGANAGLTSAYGDGWILDLESCSWEKVYSDDDGAKARFDHAAVTVGNGQIVVFGGYGDSSPADTDLHIWDSNSNSWIDSFTPTSSTSTPVSSSSTSTPTTSGESGGSVLQGATKAMSASRTVSETRIAASRKSSAANGTPTDGASTTTNPASTDAGAHSHPITTPIRIGLILGVLGLLAAVLGICLWQHRKRQRRRRQAFLLTSSSFSNGPAGGSPTKQHEGGRGEKGTALLADATMTQESQLSQASWKKGASIGLGMGAIGASLASISSKLAARRLGRPSTDPYAELHDEAPPARSSELGGPLRKSTRRIGNGIRLIGPRPQRHDTVRHALVRLGSASVRDKGNRASRMDMLDDEDQPHAIGRAPAIAEEEDWAIESDQSPSNWKPARSILSGRQAGGVTYPFEDEDDDDDLGAILPPIRGGPVPTPHDSRSDLGTYDEIATMSNPYSESSRNPHSDVSHNRYSVSLRRRSVEYHLPDLLSSDPFDLGGLMPPPVAKQYSDTSLPQSQRSGQSGGSNAMSDAEEGVVYQARRVQHASPTFVSPVETAYEPVKRTESFFRRMAAGGISSLLRPHSSSSPRPELNVRDPAPQPSLWPVISISRDEQRSTDLTAASTTSRDHVPSSWHARGLEPPSQMHDAGLSLSSLQSARSLRDMVIVQREPSGSSIESEVVIENGSLSSRRYQHADIGVQEPSHVEPAYVDLLSPLQSDRSSPIDRSEGGGHHRHGRTTGLGTPGSIVFNGADFASPSILPSSGLANSRSDTAAILDRPAFPATLGAVLNTIAGCPGDLPFSRHAEVHTPSRQTSLRPISQAPKTPEETHAPSSPSPSPSPSVNPLLRTPITAPAPAPPTGSPVPPPLLSHRRPVRDVVESINRKGGKTPLPPLNLFSPVSAYSPVMPARSGGSAADSAAPTGEGVVMKGSVGGMGPFDTSLGEGEEERRHNGLQPNNIGHAGGGVTPARSQGLPRTTTTTTTTTMWEVMKRERLKVANPDGGRGAGP